MEIFSWKGEEDELEEVIVSITVSLIPVPFIAPLIAGSLVIVVPLSTSSRLMTDPLLLIEVPLIELSMKEVPLVEVLLKELPSSERTGSGTSTGSGTLTGNSGLTGNDTLTG